MQRGGRSRWAVTRRTTGLFQDIRDADLLLRSRQFREQWGYTGPLCGQTASGQELVFGGDVSGVPENDRTWKVRH